MAEVEEEEGVPQEAGADLVVAVPVEVGRERMLDMRLISIFLILTLLLTACGVKDDAIDRQRGKPVVYASFYPLYFIVDEIGKDNLELNMVIPTGVEAHSYEPSIKQLGEIGQGDLFIYNGGGFENWVDKLLETVSLEKPAINASEQVDLIKFNNVPDPHIWLSPENMLVIAEKIKDELIELDPDHKENYEENYGELSTRLKDLDKSYFDTLENKNKESILVSHAAFAYIAERYGFEQISLMGINPEQEPSPKAISNIIDTAKDGNHEYIFLETLASPKTVEVIAKEIGLKTLELNPIEGLTKEEERNGEDYISIMDKNLQNLKKVLVD